MRAAGSHGAGPRRLRTDDVVKDAALPELKLDLSSLAALLQVWLGGNQARVQAQGQGQGQGLGRG